jgi:hypothetical protein
MVDVPKFLVEAKPMGGHNLLPLLPIEIGFNQELLKCTYLSENFGKTHHFCLIYQNYQKYFFSVENQFRFEIFARFDSKSSKTFKSKQFQGS